MTNTDIKIYKACLEFLKSGSAFNKSAIARKANVDRHTIYNKIEEHTYQDLDKFRSPEC